MDTFIDDEKEAEIQKTFSYNGYQTVRRELFAHLREPQMTIRKDSITFNTACIEGLEDTVYIQILVNQDQKRLVIKKCEKDDRDSLRWCIQKNDKRKSRKITGRQFCNMIYKMMSWDNLCRYKILGHRIDYQGETLYVFELDDAEIFRERPKRTKAELEKLREEMTPEELEAMKQREAKASRTPFYPGDLDTYGVPVEKHEDRVSLQSLDGFAGQQELQLQNQ
ncbi:MAG: integrase [Lachnospiraceae bacterium]|nr:integrase [Eubacterium sp.]MCI6638199.1 integrase [Lachnospiraceae bacterium]